MATCYPGVQNNSGKLVLVDGEDGWFLRMDGVTHYGCDPVYASAPSRRSRCASSTWKAIRARLC